MRCRLFRYLLFVFAFLLSFTFSSFLNSNPVSAVSDKVVTFTYSDDLPNGYLLCSIRECSSYRYITYSSNKSFNFPASGYRNNAIFYLQPYGNTSHGTFNASFNPYFTLSVTYHLIDFSTMQSSVSLHTSSISKSDMPEDCVITVTLSENPPGGGITPSGTYSITENGTYDITNYASVSVEVPSEECEDCPPLTYHDDLSSINNSILIVGAVLLLIYFFFCIYRMFFKSFRGVS